MHQDGYLLGIDVGSSSVKASLVEVRSGKTAGSAQSPASEMSMLTLHPGWAEQAPDMWWENVVQCTRMVLDKASVPPHGVLAIGITYQMHGLVITDKAHKPLRPAIIWCDSRAVSIGEAAQNKLGQDFCLKHYLNSPGNFTASKLRWVQVHEPEVYQRIHKAMLPGDYIALRMTGEVSTTETGLSEGILWDYQSNGLAFDLMREFSIDERILADIKKVFSIQGQLTSDAAAELNLLSGTPISYRAGDQPNNAFSLKVLEPGETAATAGTSGVIYAVTDQAAHDKQSRVNTFIHVNNEAVRKRNGVLLCVNGAGILNSWLRKNVYGTGGYDQINALAASVPAGSAGLCLLPFGNGAERILENRTIGSSVHGLDLNRHSQAHLFRAAQEGIVFAMMHGFEILQQMGMESSVIRAGLANMFLSPVFREAFVNTTQVPLELYDADGAKGAALGAGIGAGVYKSFDEAFAGLNLLESSSPEASLSDQYQLAYQKWKTVLNRSL
jgi:xylulokinase